MKKKNMQHDNNNNKDDTQNLRQAAVEKLQTKKQAITEHIDNMTPEYISKMVHELKVHQIELEMQNEELRNTQLELDISRSKYFDLYEFAPVGYCTLDHKGNILEVNLTASKLWGTHRSELIRKPFTRFIMRDDQDIFYKHQKKIRMTHKPGECELRMLGPEEAPFWTLLSTVFVEDENGSQIFRVVISDISARKEAEREIIKTKEKAIAANEAKTQFLANMSHEIRTPLNGLMGMLQLMAMTELDEEQKELVDIAKLSSDALLAVIGDILDYSKIEAGEMQLEKIEFDVKKVLKDVVDVFWISSALKDVVIEVIVDDDIPHLVGDSFRFRQILSNLIGNAVKYTHSGKIVIELNKMELSDNHKMGLKCSIQDTGIGIHPDKLQSMFERFNQVDSSNTRQYGGTGLGLAISKGLVEKMGGELWVESVLGEGSCFTFTCNMALVNEEEDDSTQEMTETVESQKSLELLLVEDEVTSIILIEKIASMNGWHIMTAADGRQGVEMFKANSFDAVILDIQLPVFDGFIATGMMREWEAKKDTRTPIIALTAHVTDRAREKCIDAGMDEYLAKPFGSEELKSMIEKMTVRKEQKMTEIS